MKNFVFDLGGVLLEWNPLTIVEIFTDKNEEREKLLNYMHSEEKWVKWDVGQLSDNEFAQEISSHTGISKQEIDRFLMLIKESLIIIPETLELINFAAKNGKNVFCISNMPAETYSYLKEKYSFFQLFKGIIISGIEKAAKPDPILFNTLLERYSLIPDDTLFIDDSKKNLEAAADFGIQTIHFTREEECFFRIKNMIMN
jgi:putative hydrolase of the HAD superfamily